MKKLVQKYFSGILVLTLLAGMAGLGHADRRSVVTPQNQKRGEASFRYSGYQYYYVNASGEQAVCLGACLLAGVYMSTGHGGAHLTFRNTDSADGGGTPMLPNQHFRAGTGAQNNRFEFPVVASDGITVQLIGATSSNESATVLWLQLNY